MQLSVSKNAVERKARRKIRKNRERRRMPRAVTGRGARAQKKGERGF